MFHRIPVALVVAPAIFAAPLFAQEPTLRVLICAPGGCEIGASALTAEDYRVLTGQPDLQIDPARQSILITELPNSRPVLTDAAPEDFDTLFGGDGKVVSRVFSPDDQGRVPIPLFEGEVAGDAGADGDIVPRDGLWRITSADQIFERCPAQMEAMFRGMGGIDRQDETHRISWGGKFDPDALDFMNGDGQEITWTRTGPNSFEGKLFEVSSGGGSVGADVGMEIVTPTQIESYSVLDIALLAGGVDLSVMPGMADCRITMTFDMTHVGE